MVASSCSKERGPDAFTQQSGPKSTLPKDRVARGHNVRKRRNNKQARATKQRTSHRASCRILIVLIFTRAHAHMAYYAGVLCSRKPGKSRPRIYTPLLTDRIRHVIRCRRAKKCATAACGTCTPGPHGPLVVDMGSIEGVLPPPPNMNASNAT